MILIQAILSWLPTSIQEHPAMEVLNLLVAPALKPIQKFLPTLGGFDFSPLAALIVIQVVKMIIITPFISVGVRMMLL
jgi:YggT family protein